MTTLNDYQTAALRTAGPNRGNLAYSMGGVGGESGEYVDVVKKHLFHGKPYDVSRVNALKELGDLQWGIAQAADAWGFTLEEVAAANISKLTQRYPRGFTTEAAAARADEVPFADPSDVIEVGWDGNGSPSFDTIITRSEVTQPGVPVFL